MACDRAAQDSRTSYLILRVPNAEIEIWAYQGDFSASALQADQSDVAVYTAQGRTHTVRKGNRVDPSGSFTAHFDGWTSETAERALDFIRKTGKYASNQRSSAICGDAYLIDIVQVFRGDGSASDRRVVYEACRITADYASGDPDSLSCSWTCYGDVNDYLMIP